MPQVGDHVIFVDPVAEEHDAIVIAVWGAGQPGTNDVAPALNVMYADPDETKTDSYGRQIARSTSVVHKSNQAAHGMFWREP